MLVKIVGTHRSWSSTHFRESWGKQIVMVLLFILFVYYLTVTEISPDQLQVQSGPVIWTATGDVMTWVHW